MESVPALLSFWFYANFTVMQNKNFQTHSFLHIFSSRTRVSRTKMASESFLAVPTVPNPQQSSTNYGVNLDHMALLESVEAFTCEGVDEEFNLEALRVISDAISAPSGANNEAPMNNINNASSDVATCSTYSKKGRGARSKSSKKASQENVVVQSQPSLQVLTTPQDVILKPVEYVPHQHVNNAPNHNTNVVFQANPQNNAAPFQPRPLVSPAPCCSPITGVQMAEMMFASKASFKSRILEVDFR